MKKERKVERRSQKIVRRNKEEGEKSDAYCGQGDGGKQALAVPRLGGI
jgi:hypothetical protein